MRFDVVSLFPELVQQVTRFGVVSRALQDDIFAIHYWNPRDFSSNIHRTVDDKPFGGGPGMVMQYQPLKNCIQAVRKQSDGPVIYLSPQGKVLDQNAIRRFTQCSSITLVAGRYEGVDERFIESEVDEEWSLGDYVISGGEIAAMVVVDAVVRLLPGALGDAESAQQDSFMNGLLDFPHYTRPELVEGQAVPKVLLSGDHSKIAQWRRQQALIRTKQRRPDLLDKLDLSSSDKALLDDEHNAG